MPTKTMIRLNSIGANVDLAAAIDHVNNWGACGLSKESMTEATCDIDPRLSWEELATSERILLCFIWESAYRQPCPLPMH